MLFPLFSVQWTCTFLSRLSSKVSTPSSTQGTALTTLHLCSPKASPAVPLVPTPVTSYPRVSLPHLTEAQGCKDCVWLTGLPPDQLPLLNHVPLIFAEERKYFSGQAWVTRRELRGIQPFSPQWKLINILLSEIWSLGGNQDINWRAALSENTFRFW